MKGLLHTEIYFMAQNHRHSLFLAVVLFAAFFLDQENPFFLYMICILAMQIPLSSLSYDELDKWNLYSQTLPYTKGQYVSEKYVLGLLLALVITAVLGTVILFLMEFPGTAKLLMLTGMLVGSLIPSALILPLAFRFGTSKARVIYIIPMGILLGVIGIGTSQAGSLAMTIKEGGVDPSAFLTMFCVLIAALSGVVYAVSWMLSIAWYPRREEK